MEVDESHQDDKSELRSIECTLSLLERSDGSAGFCHGKTEVVTAVYGPAEVKLSKELMDKATVECIFKQKTGLGGCQEKLIEKFIRNTADTILLSQHHPRSSISIICQVIQNEGSLMACAINSVCMACLNAGIPMDCMFAAVSCTLNEEGDITLDPSCTDEKNARAQITIVFESKNYNVITIETRGKLSTDEYFQCLAVCKKASKTVFQFQRNCVERFLSKEKTMTSKPPTDWFS